MIVIFYISTQKLKKKCFMKKKTTYNNISAVNIPFKSILEAQFRYCFLRWVFCSRSANSKINKLRERSLRIIYDDSNSKFEDFLTRDSSFITHHQNIQTLEIGFHKFHKSLFWMKITFIVYDLNQTFKFQELTLLWKEQSPYDILDQ